MATDFDDLIETAAASPAEASDDAGAMKAVSIPDLIAAKKDAAAAAALDGLNPNGGPRSGWGAAVRPARGIPGGAV